MTGEGESTRKGIRDEEKGKGHDMLCSALLTPRLAHIHTHTRKSTLAGSVVRTWVGRSVYGLLCSICVCMSWLTKKVRRRLYTMNCLCKISSVIYSHILCCHGLVWYLVYGILGKEMVIMLFFCILVFLEFLDAEFWGNQDDIRSKPWTKYIPLRMPLILPFIIFLLSPSLTLHA